MNVDVSLASRRPLYTRPLRPLPSNQCTRLILCLLSWNAWNADRTSPRASRRGWRSPRRSPPSSAAAAGAFLDVFGGFLRSLSGSGELALTVLEGFEVVGMSGFVLACPERSRSDLRCDYRSHWSTAIGDTFARAEPDCILQNRVGDVVHERLFERGCRTDLVDCPHPMVEAIFLWSGLCGKTIVVGTYLISFLVPGVCCGRTDQRPSSRSN